MVPSDFKKEGTRVFDYTVTFGGNEEILKKYKYKLLSDKPYKLKFVMTATPGMFMELLVDNLNLYDSGWTVGTVIEAPEKLLSFNHEKCWAVLGRLAEEFDTEFEIVGKTINLRKVEYYKDAPLKLSYGKGNGFLPGVGRANQGDNLPVEILYVQGGERNIDYSAYGSQTLLLPKSQELEYQADGTRPTRTGCMSLARTGPFPLIMRTATTPAIYIHPGSARWARPTRSRARTRTGTMSRSTTSMTHRFPPTSISRIA